MAAEVSAREAMELYSTALPAGHHYWHIARSKIGSALRDQGRFDEAEPLVVESTEAILDDTRARRAAVRAMGTRRVG